MLKEQSNEVYDLQLNNQLNTLAWAMSKKTISWIQLIPKRTFTILRMCISQLYCKPRVTICLKQILFK